MYASWQQYINDFKQLVHMHSSLPLRLSLFQQQLQQYWESCSLTTMEQITMLNTPTVISFIYEQILPSYLSTRRVHQEAYSVNLVDEKGQEQSVMYVYDCRLFRGNSFSKEQNDFISSFMLIYREEAPINDRVHEVVDVNNIPAGQWILKVKESGLLRVHAYMRQTMARLRHKQDKIILGQEQYQPFIHEWVKCYCNYNLDVALGYFFRGVLVLLQNQMLRVYVSTLTPSQLHQRIQRRPIRVIDKPKNVEQFTLTQGKAETETQWQTLKITAFKLKYRVEEDAQRYLCYLAVEDEEEGVCELSQEDRVMLYALEEERKKEEAYRQLFT